MELERLALTKTKGIRFIMFIIILAAIAILFMFGEGRSVAGSSHEIRESGITEDLPEKERNVLRQGDIGRSVSMESDNGDKSYHSPSNAFFIYPLLMFIGSLVSVVFMIVMRKGINGLMVLGIILILIGFSISTLIVPSFVNSPEEYEEWLQKPRSEGDSIWVGGYVTNYTSIEFGGQALYTYFLEGSSVPVYGTDDLGEEGDYIIINIEVDEHGAPTKSKGMEKFMIFFPTFVLVGLGVLIAFLGFRKEKAGNVLGAAPPGYPDTAYGPQTPYQQMPPQHMPPPGQYYQPASPPYPTQAQQPTNLQPPTARQYSPGGGPHQIVTCPRCGQQIDQRYGYCTSCGFRG